MSCSTKKNSFVGRKWHALNTEYNTLYNGGLALDLGINELKVGYQDNFWEILPIERMQILEESFLPGQKPKNANFERAETKATKAIQKHSMNIAGKEKNTQMNEAHLMLGQARYYDQRFIPALEAFNYILYKYSNSGNINEAKIWREKTNIRLENDALAVKNLKKLLKNHKLEKQVLADANAILAQGYINLEHKDSAIAPLKVALKATRLKEEKARYHFILGQLYESQKHTDSAFNEYQEVIKMKRKSPRRYTIQSHAKQAMLSTVTNDTIIFLEKYAKLLKDRENRGFLDVLNFQVAEFYNQLNKKNNAVKYYNKSLRAPSNDAYLQATTYKKLATIYFDRSKYLTAGKYYDSTLTKLVKKNREYFSILKKRENLVDVIKYEGIVQYNDSILNIANMSDAQKTAYFDEYIIKLKAKDEALRLAEAKKLEANSNTGMQDIVTVATDNKLGLPGNIMPPMQSTDFKVVTNNSSNQFYFYTPSTVAFGKLEFRKRWGKRVLKENWRLSKLSQDIKEQENNIIADDKNLVLEPTSEKYSADFYIKKMPTSTVVLDSLFKQRNFANYQLGVIYKEKFQELNLSAAKFELLLQNKPEERFILPSMYNLYKIYEITNKEKAEIVKNDIILKYPNTRYAQILSGKLLEENTIAGTPSETYKTVFKQFKNQEYVVVLNTIDQSLNQFAGDDLIPKFELLKANTIGKLKGINEYRKAINYVALSFPNSEEGKQAENIMNVNIPQLEQLEFKNDSLSKSWKILYKAGSRDDVATKTLMEKINKYIVEKKYDLFSVSYDVFTETENFVVVHGISSTDFARFFKTILKETKEIKIEQPAQIISTHNYTVLQVKKNYNQFLELKI